MAYLSMTNIYLNLINDVSKRSDYSAYSYMEGEFAMKDKSAFTLVEVMIVVAIIALLATIAIPNFLRSRIEANDTSAKASLKTIGTALESYYAINSVYPNNASGLVSGTMPYLHKDFFTGTHNGFTYGPTISPHSYTVVATPVSSNFGSSTFTITTGAVLN